MSVQHDPVLDDTTEPVINQKVKEARTENLVGLEGALAEGLRTSWTCENR